MPNPSLPPANPFDPATSDYPRDMVGYGRNPPDPQWPGGALLALQIVVNYEEGGENSILHGDAGTESFLTEHIVTSQKGVRSPTAESLWEYGSRVGFWRLWRLLSGRSLPVTCFGVTMALGRNPEAVAAMREAGWEIATHGMRWNVAAPADEAGERLRRMVPPQATGGASPEVQKLQQQLQAVQQHGSAITGQADQHLAALSKQVAGLQQQLADKDAEHARATYEAETRRMAAVGKIDPAAMLPIIRQMVSEVLGTPALPVMQAHTAEDALHGQAGDLRGGALGGEREGSGRARDARRGSGLASRDLRGGEPFPRPRRPLRRRGSENRGADSRRAHDDASIVLCRCARVGPDPQDPSRRFPCRSEAPG